MAQKCLLFTYGLLQPGKHPPRSLSQHWPDAILGTLYDLGDFPAAVDLRSPNDQDATHDHDQHRDHNPDHDKTSWIEGYVLEIDADELSAIDEFEDIDGGEYRRLLVTTRSGRVAWAYEYLRAIPTGRQPITRWPVP